MSGNHRGPFTRAGVIVLNGNKHEVCRCVGQCEAEDVVTALNMWAYQPDVPPKSEPGGICDKCLGLHRSAFVGQKCISSKDCGGTVQDIKTPQPNREETDRVAMEFIKAERKIQPQYWEDGQWHNTVIGEGVLPPFDYGLPWRIKPTKRRVVVEIYKTPTGDLISRIQNGRPGPPIFTFVGTIEGEVEA